MKKLVFFLVLLPFLGFGQVQIGNTVEGNFSASRIGWTVDLSSDGNVFATGGWLFMDDQDLEGQVRVYGNIDNTWIQLGEDIIGDNDGDRFGWSTSLSSDGTIIAIGATGPNLARVYKYENDIWSQMGQDIVGQTGGSFGSSIALSSDGTIVAIGAPFNDDNGSDSGQVKIYEFENDLVKF